ncbi:MAG TPA: FMN-binding glutamate synthase family protein [Pseudomonadales bacterium]|nr:FMN-binding glutamate synthase family protein [Pseudomonadales bacterium]HNH19146.1 FMN-binding glutamate synthase family protein [Pseudomonadales bacterium]HNL30893.1 FMN-binding glutamate synthase family protein [Pseudomonadales bacterium]HNN36027.1 FMN-binding glutamate synthase family protein [Pseudomonadales bacterium]HQN40503.1 FMN-binding glutamate synthase family protein [Pseudomonadales bacterium]
MQAPMHWFTTLLDLLAVLFIFMLGALCLTLLAWYFIDRHQKSHAIRRNFPLIGRFRYLFEWLGEFFRQYFFAMDREELPFNRAERSWVYRAAKNLEQTAAFGSTNNLATPGALFFVHSTFPTAAAEPPAPVVIGPDTPHPYQADKFFNISAMSYGAISRPAVLALSRGAALAGCWLNTGEGGLSPYHLEGGADLVFQLGTAKYGARDPQGNLSEEKLARIAAHPAVRLFEIKLSQGAKPGKGGILPAAKVTEEIAAIRGIPMGHDSLSPAGHLDARDIDGLLTLIDRVRRATGKPVGIKACIGESSWLDQLCIELNCRGFDSAPDFITVDGAEGGSGAAPQSLLDYMGLPIRESLPLVVDTLVTHGLRERIKVVASGKLINPVEVAWALCMGADCINSARGFMFALGCIQSLKCNQNNCPTGITTHRIDLQQGLDPTDKAERVRHYQQNLEREVAVIAHACGVESPRQLRRHHARMVVEAGRSVSLHERYPPAVIPVTAVGADR